MRFTYSIHTRCPCPAGQKCPKLWRKDGSWNSRHGSAGYACRVPTSAGARAIKRYGFGSKAEAEAAAKAVGELLDLAGADGTARAKIGDLIIKIKRGGALPEKADVARRLGLNQDPASAGITFGEAWPAWLAGKKKLRLSAKVRLTEIGRNWLLPVLAEVPLERLNGGHVAMVFDRIEWISEEITRQRGEGRAWIHVNGNAEFASDVRTRPRPVGVASQHRVYAALREWANFEVTKTTRLARNPVYAVELAAEEEYDAQWWSPGQTARFLDATADHPLGLLFRIVLLCGARRSEACGFRWAGTDLDAGVLSNVKPRVHVGAVIDEPPPKTKQSKRRVYLDAETAGLLRAHRRAQVAARMRAGEAWADADLVFCREDGTGYRPDYVSRQFKLAAKRAGLPQIRVHDTRHTAASLANEADVDAETRRKALGHADAAMTSHYTHVRAELHRAAAEQVAALVKAAGS